MSDWIEQKVAEIKIKEEESAKTKTQKQKEEAQKLIAQAQEIVDRLEALVTHDVEKWNELVPGYRRRIDGVFKSRPSGGFQVRKTAYPPAAVEAILDIDSMSIIVETTKSRFKDEPPYTVRSQIQMRRDANGDLHLATQSGEPIPISEVSRLLLEPVIEATAEAK